MQRIARLEPVEAFAHIIYRHICIVKIYCFNFRQMYQVLSDWVLMRYKSRAPKYNLYAQNLKSSPFSHVSNPPYVPSSGGLCHDSIFILLLSFT